MTILMQGHGGLDDLRRSQPAFAAEIEAVALAAGVDERHAFAFFNEVYSERIAPIPASIRETIEQHLQHAPMLSATHATWVAAAAQRDAEQEWLARGRPGTFKEWFASRVKSEP